MYHKDHALWDQIVRKESETKHRFEILTGETSAKKFYNGQNHRNVSQRIVTLNNAHFRTMQGRKDKGQALSHEDQ